MVGLPSIESRERILKTLMSKEKTEDLDFKELATMTEGYTGSDLKVCSFCFSIFQNIYSIHQTNS
jgi:SpoVK/Ycf46/Vps4 family AAA+-type ATPase